MEFDDSELTSGDPEADTTMTSNDDALEEKTNDIDPTQEPVTKVASKVTKVDDKKPGIPKAGVAKTTTATTKPATKVVKEDPKVTFQLFTKKIIH